VRARARRTGAGRGLTLAARWRYRAAVATTGTAPHFRLPGVHYVGALVWLVLGSAGLVVVAPDLAAARFLAPRVLAVTHLFTLGVIAASVFGALYQFYPMALGVRARSVRVGIFGAWLLHAGIAALVLGLGLGQPVLQAVAWWLLFAAIGCVSWNLLPHRRRLTAGRREATYVTAAHSMLGLALFVAGGRIGAALGWWQLGRLGAIAAHFHLAAFGFVGLTAVGVGGRLLPMFLVAGAGPSWPLRVIGPLGSAGLLALAGGLLLGSRAAVRVGAALGLVAVLLFVGLVGRHLYRRFAALEPAFGHVVAGFVALLLAVAAGVRQLVVPGASLRGWVVYAELTILGWLVVFITGIWYRLFAFLIWLHFHGARGEAKVRTLAELLSRPVGWTVLGLLIAGVGTLVSATAAGLPGLARAGAVGVLLAALLLAAQYARLYAARFGGG
jgi:hypothetical protein